MTCNAANNTAEANSHSDPLMHPRGNVPLTTIFSLSLILPARRVSLLTRRDSWKAFPRAPDGWRRGGCLHTRLNCATPDGGSSAGYCLDKHRPVGVGKTQTKEEMKGKFTKVIIRHTVNRHR